MVRQHRLVQSALILGLALPVLGGCGSDVTVVTTTIAPSLTGRLGEQPTLTLIAQVLRDSGREAALAEGGPYTLFVPTNEALETYARSVGYADATSLISDVSQGSGRGVRFLDDVIVQGTVRGEDFAPNANETFQTSAGTDVTINIVDGAVVLTTATTRATVSAVDVVLGDITVHVVDTVLA